MSTYATAKSGVIGLTRHAAVEYAKEGIRINAIAPGYIKTGIQAKAHPEAVKAMDDMVIENTPMGRVGMPDDLKGVAVWLASDASSFVTGQTIVVDGGLIS